MPLASVIYAVTFDGRGTPIVQAKIHTDTSGRAIFTGDAGKAFSMLSAALETTTKRLATCIADQMTRGIEEKRMLQAELIEGHDDCPRPLPIDAPKQPPLPAAGEVF